jgi:hypothetical protein
MQTVPSSLIARLRRRLTASVWLFAFVLTVKTGFAIGCSTDGIDGDAQQRQGAAVHTIAETAAQDGSMSPDHAGNGSGSHESHAGCHCSCAHSSTLPTLNCAVDCLSAAATRFPSGTSLYLPTNPLAELRPPIA